MSSRNKLLISSIAGLALLGCCLSAYLTWTSWSATNVAGCDGNSPLDCDAVLGTQWSHWLGVPVSLFGLLTYVGLLGCCGWYATRAKDLAATALLTLSLMAAGAAVWFVGLQAVIVQSFCLYCLAVHACGLTIGVLTLLLVGGSSGATDYQQMSALLGVATSSPEEEMAEASPARGVASPLIATAIAMVGMAALVAGQLLMAPESMVLEQIAELPVVDGEDEPAEELSFSANETPNADDASDWLDEPTSGPRRLKFQGLRNRVDLSQSVVIGDPMAEHVIIEMMDYTCRHCRTLHPHLRAALDRYEPQLAFVIHHTPLSRDCNPHVKRRSREHRNACDYAKLAIGIWHVAPDKFLEFHEWLLEGEKPPPISTAKARALKLAGEQVHTDQSLRAKAGRAVAEHCHTLNGLQGGLPVLITSRGVIRGVPKTEGEWFDFLEQQLDLKPAGEDPRSEVQ